MHLSSQSQTDYLSLGISSPGFVCWQKAKAGADTWLIKCLSTMLTAVPEGRDRLCQCPVICYCCTHLTLVICLWGATFWGRLFLLQGSQGLSLLSSRFFVGVLWRLHLLKPSAATKTLNGHLPLIFVRVPITEGPWRSLKIWYFRKRWAEQYEKLMEVQEAAVFSPFHQSMEKEDNSFPDMGRNRLG